MRTEQERKANADQTQTRFSMGGGCWQQALLHYGAHGVTPRGPAPKRVGRPASGPPGKTRGAGPAFGPASRLE